MLLHYLVKLKNQKFAILMHVKHLSGAKYMCKISFKEKPEILPEVTRYLFWHILYIAVCALVNFTS